jgi:hypothetical protein
MKMQDIVFGDRAGVRNLLETLDIHSIHQECVSG